MRRLCKIVFIVLVLAWGAASLRHAQGHRGNVVGRQDDSSASLEIFDTGDETAPPSFRIKMIANHTAAWAKDYEIDE